MLIKDAGNGIETLIDLLKATVDQIEATVDQIETTVMVGHFLRHLLQQLVDRCQINAIAALHGRIIAGVRPGTNLQQPACFRFSRAMKRL